MNQSLELEEQVVGTILTYPDWLPDLPLQAEWITDPKLRTILMTITRMQNEGKAVDLLLLAKQLPDGMTWLGDLAALQAKVTTSIHIHEHIAMLREMWLQRELIAIGQRLAQLPNSSTTQLTINDLILQTEDELYRLGESGIQHEATLVAEDVDEAVERVRKACETKTAVTGIPTGFAQLDKMLLGLQPTDLIIIAARPSVGKTALAVSMAKNITNSPKTAVAVFSLEMGREQICNRLLMQLSGIRGETVRGGVMSPLEQQNLLQAADTLRTMPIYIDDTPSLSVSQLRTKARKLVRRNGVRLIIVDYLQLMTATVSKNANRENEVSAVSRALKCLAKELHVPIVALAQLNREGERGMERREPRLSDLRESGAIEQDADIVMLLHEPKTALEGERELIIAKHRNGATGSVLLHFDKPTAMFSTLPVAEQNGGQPTLFG